MAESKGSRNWRSALDVMATLSIILACLTLAGVLLASRFEVRPPPVPQPGAEGGRERSSDSVTSTLELAATPLKGRRSAKVAVIEFSDFECPFCGRFARETFPLISERYVETGKVLYGFRHFPIESRHPNAVLAATAAACGEDDGRFWEMHHALFELPLRLEREALLAKAGSAGLDLVRFDGCLQTRAEKVMEDLETARTLGLTGTPTFLFGLVENGSRLRIIRRESGAIPPAAFSRILDQLLIKQAQ